MFEFWCGSSKDGFLGTCDLFSYDGANQTHHYVFVCMTLFCYCTSCLNLNSYRAFCGLNFVFIHCLPFIYKYWICLLCQSRFSNKLSTSITAVDKSGDWEIENSLSCGSGQIRIRCVFIYSILTLVCNSNMLILLI